MYFMRINLMAASCINIKMKINEVCSPLKTFLVTVRVALKSSTATSRTTINADSSSHAYLMLSRLYGVGNVISLSEVVNEAPKTDQIHLDELFTPQNDNRQVPHRKNALTRSSQATQQRRQRQRDKVATMPIADPIKHGLIQDMLTKQLVRQSNIVKPNVDDLQIAKSRAATALKRADLDYEKKVQRELRRRK